LTGNLFQVRVLVIDDDELIRDVFKASLSALGYEVIVAKTGAAGIEHARQRTFDVVITDLRLPDMAGEDVLTAVHEIEPETIVLIITGFATVDSSLAALQMGAEDYIPKPVNFQHLNLVMERSLQRRRLRRKHAELARASSRRQSLCGLAGSSIKMNEVYRQIAALAGNDMTILLQGETGTGKELAARAIHQLGPRKDRPFIPVNCGSLPDSLLESELFGYVKGAFTGADKDKGGLFDAAQHGTILLDEIEAAPHSTQVALLRVLDRKEVRPLGGGAPVPIDVRIMAACNKDLEAMVEAGDFREDLFFRIIEATVTMPPLREKLEDIPLLVQVFLDEAGTPKGKEKRRFSPQSLASLAKYSWPGNVRELKHVALSAASTSPRPIVRPGDLPDKIRSNNGARPKFQTLMQRERAQLLEALEACRSNKAEAARILGISRGTIYSLLQKHGIGSPSEPNSS